jgi:hypothetical protein
MHEVKINIIGSKRLQGRVNSLRNSLVPRVVEFCSEEDLGSWDSRSLDSLADFSLVTICKLNLYQHNSLRVPTSCTNRGVNVSVSSF